MAVIKQLQYKDQTIVLPKEIEIDTDQSSVGQLITIVKILCEELEKESFIE